MSVNPNLYAELEWRGLVKQVTDPDLSKAMAGQSLTLYAGFDPTADSLHVGHLLPLMTLRRFQQAGHRSIAVAGGATGQVGDPSGKASERQLLTREIIARNVKGIEAIMGRLLSFDGANPAALVNNAAFYDGMSYLDFLRDVGKHFTVNMMLAKESVRARLEDRDQGISYTEFSYMLLQAYDFYRLHEDEGCRLQIGGSDQWGNITAGCELIRRMAAAHSRPAPQVFGLTLPLVLKSDGTKFGKTEGGAVWLSADRTPPYAFYQYFLNTADSDVGTLLRYFTFLPKEEIESLERSTKASPEGRAGQKRLAEEMTLLVHGADALKDAQAATQALFSGGVASLSASALMDSLAEAPRTTRPAAQAEGATLVDLLAETGLCPSKGQARKDIQAGGIYVNDQRVQDVAWKASGTSLLHGKFLVLRKGKKTYHLVIFG
ncbi:MAG: tyrosine--tRNA ligase [Bdellovibrionales bacterium]|nr:tyrosine--tRNA ligase [Bdellovibrionales bacterium]